MTTTSTTATAPRVSMETLDIFLDLGFQTAVVGQSFFVAAEGARAFVNAAWRAGELRGHLELIEPRAPGYSASWTVTFGTDIDGALLAAAHHAVGVLHEHVVAGTIALHAQPSALSTSNLIAVFS